LRRRLARKRESSTFARSMQQRHSEATLTVPRKAHPGSIFSWAQAFPIWTCSQGIRCRAPVARHLPPDVPGVHESPGSGSCPQPAAFPCALGNPLVNGESNVHGHSICAHNLCQSLASSAGQTLKSNQSDRKHSPAAPEALNRAPGPNKS